MEDVVKDKRFAHIAKDPRFRQIKRADRKVKIDKRFHGMFKDKQFKVKYQVDKRGRPTTATSSENLRKFYDASDDDEEADVASQKSKEPKKKKELKKQDKAEKQKPSMKSTKTASVSSALASKASVHALKGKKLAEQKGTHAIQQEVEQSSNGSSDGESDASEGSESEEESSDVSDLGSDTKEDTNLKFVPDVTEIDLARGEGTVVSSSDEDEDESVEEFKEDDFDHKWGEMDQDAVEVEEATCRLAICNMDWDRIKAADLMIMLNSFKPTGGLIKSVKIYPSEYGVERMKKEEVQGPIELTEKIPADKKEDDDDGAEYHREKLRQYQLNRLKYYYAVAAFDSAKTASAVYEECDGIEYESSSTKLDLRFIPDDMEFDQAPKDEASDVPDSATYKPTLFSNSALQQSNVRLTWDETPQDRVAVTMKQYKSDEVEDMDLKAYLASSSEEEDEDQGSKDVDLNDSEEGEVDNEDTAIQKYRQLLTHIKGAEERKENKDIDMEITWEPGLKEATETIVKKKEKEKDKQSPWEKYLEKKKDKQMKKREEKMNKQPKTETIHADDGEESDEYIPCGIDMDDPYFKDELVSDEGKKDKRKKKRRRGMPEKTEEDEREEAQMDLLTMDDDDHRGHFSLEKIIDSEASVSKKKRKKQLRHQSKNATAKFEDKFQINVEDSRFNAIFENPMYNIDPSAPQFKKTKAMDKLMDEKMTRRKRKGTDGISGSDPKSSSAKQKTPKSDTNQTESAGGARGKSLVLASLVKSVKTKTQNLNKSKLKRDT